MCVCWVGLWFCWCFEVGCCAVIGCLLYCLIGGYGLLVFVVCLV